MIQRHEDPVDQTDPVPNSPALHEVWFSRPGGYGGAGGRCVVGYECRGDQGVQPARLDRTGADQVQIGQHPGRRVGQDGQGGDTAVRGRPGDPQGGRSEAVPVRGRLQQQPAPSSEPHGDGAVRPPLGAEQDRRLVRPPANGTPELPRHQSPRIRVRGRGVGGQRTCAGPDPQRITPARVPEMTVQVEAEPPVGMGVRMSSGAGLGMGSVPQREADPLTAVRPGRRSTDHQVHRRSVVPPGSVVPGEGNGQTWAQQSVGSDPRHVPAQQVGGQMAEIGPDPGREVAAMSAGHGAQIEVDIDACGGACACPVPGMAAGGRSLDHGRRHGVGTHARPEGKAGIPVRDLSEHQHSPCADGTPNL